MKINIERLIKPVRLSSVPSGSNLLQSWLQRDGVIILLYILATVVMTYPLAFRLNGDWLSMRDADTFIKVWDIWWFSEHALSSSDLLFTNEIFYPLGVDLSFHSISWTVVVGSWLLAAFVGQVVAYNLSILIAVFTTGYAAYVLIYSIVNDRAAAWLGGVIYTFAPYHIAHSTAHPDLVHLAPIPLAVLFLGYAITKRSLLAAFVAAVMIGLAAFTSLYIMVFSLLTVLPIFAWFGLENGRWREWWFWKIVLALGLVAASLLAIRLVPIIDDPSNLSSAIEAKYTASKSQTDLLAFIIPSRYHPVFRPLVKQVVSGFIMNKKWPAYLGFIPLALTAIALIKSRRRRQVYIWFAIGVLFFLLSLGPILRFNGEAYESIRLPAGYLSRFPPIRAVGRPDFFVLGVLLPLAVCAAYGLNYLLKSLHTKQVRKYALTVLLTVLLLFEFWNGPYPFRHAKVNSFYQQIAKEEGEFALIPLPMSRQKNKLYLYQQVFHQKPIAAGVIARTPTEAFNYINDNYLLNRWRKLGKLECNDESMPAIKKALDQLAKDGFRYIIVHNRDNSRELLSPYFPVMPVYQDKDLSAYLINDIRARPPCWQTS